MAWSLTTKETERRVQAVLLMDGAWHACYKASFKVDEEGGMASWRSQEDMIIAANLDTIAALRVLQLERH